MWASRPPPEMERARDAFPGWITVPLDQINLTRVVSKSRKVGVAHAT